MKRVHALEEHNGIYMIDHNDDFVWIQGPQNHFPNLLTGIDYNKAFFKDDQIQSFSIYWDEYPSNEKDLPMKEGRSIIKLSGNQKDDSWNVLSNVEYLHQMKRIQNLAIFMYDVMKIELNFIPMNDETDEEIVFPEEDYSHLEPLLFGKDILLYPIHHTICGDGLIISYRSFCRLMKIQWKMDVYYNDDYNFEISSNQTDYNIIDCCYYIPQILELLHAMNKPTTDDDLCVRVYLDDYTMEFNADSYASNYTLSIENLPYFNMYDRIAYVVNKLFYQEGGQS